MQASTSHIQALLAERQAAAQHSTDPWELIDRNLAILAEFSRTWTEPEDFQYLAHMRSLVQELRAAHFNLSCEIEEALRIHSQDMIAVLREMMVVAEHEVDACADALRLVVDGASQDGLGTFESVATSMREEAARKERDAAPELVEMSPLLAPRPQAEAAKAAKPLTPISKLSAGRVADDKVPPEFWFPQTGTRGQWVN